MNIELLAQFYERLIRDKVNRAKNANQFTYDEPHKVREEWKVLFGTDSDYDSPKEYLKEDFYDTRQKLLIGKLFDRISVINEHNLEKIVDTVRDPMLDGAFIWTGSHGGLGNVDRASFVNGFDGRIGIVHRKLPTYLRPIIFLQLVEEAPEVMSRLMESSSYYPHRLFFKKVPSVRQIDEEIAVLLPELFSEELIGILPEIEKFMELTYVQNRKLGKYELPRNFTCLNFIQSGRDAEAKLDELYGDRQVKREVYETLDQCLRTTSQQFYSGMASADALKIHSSKFSLTRVEWFTAFETLRNYAVNQLLLMWKESKGQIPIPETVFSRARKVKARAEGDKLIVKGGGISGKLVLNQQSYSFNTTIYLPFCVYILNKLYKTALAYTKPN